MAAGDRETFDKVKPVLDVQGENVFYLGALGDAGIGNGNVPEIFDYFVKLET
jgi:hypothetical protein